MGKVFRTVAALLVICLMASCFAGCGGKKPEAAKAEITLPKVNSARAQVEKRAATYVEHYVLAQLLSAKLAKTDVKKVPFMERCEMLEDCAKAWRTVYEETTALEAGAGLLREAEKRPGYKGTAALPEVLLIPADRPFFEMKVAHAGGKKGSVESTVKWAERLTHDFDSCPAGAKIETLAKQMRISSAEAYNKLKKAQKLLQDKSMTEAKFNDNVVKTLQAVNTGSKVVLLGAGLSGAVAGGAALGVMKGGALVLGTADAIVSVGETTSAIVLGEDHQTTVAFKDIKDNPYFGTANAVFGVSCFQAGGDAADRLVYIGSSLNELVQEKKLAGGFIDWTQDGSVKILGFEVANSDTTEKVLDEFFKADEVLSKRLKYRTGAPVDAASLHTLDNIPFEGIENYLDDFTADVRSTVVRDYSTPLPQIGPYTPPPASSWTKNNSTMSFPTNGSMLEKPQKGGQDPNARYIPKADSDEAPQSAGQKPKKKLDMGNIDTGNVNEAMKKAILGK